MAENWTTSDAAELHGIKALAYGGAGSGKTMQVATLPRPVLISAENGGLSLKRRNIEKVFGAGRTDITYDIPILEIRQVGDLESAYQAMSKYSTQFDSAALDSVSEIAETILKNAKPQYKDPRKAYGDMLEQMLDVLKKFRDLRGKHVYMSAKQGRFDDEVSGAALFGPMTPGKALSQELPYLFDLVLQLSRVQPPDLTKPPYHIFRTAPDFSYQAKDRSGVLDPRGEPADMGHIIRKISAAVQ